MPREIVTMFSGQGGCQMGSAVWELLCAEHGVNPDGSVSSSSNDILFKKMEGSEATCGSLFFYQGCRGQQVPRAIFADLEDIVVGEIRTGTYRNLFHPDNLVTGIEDAASIFSRGYYSLGTTRIDSVMEAYRNLLEECDGLLGITAVHTTGGGTGSGFHCLMTEHIRDETPKTTLLECNVCPSTQYASNTVEPYNAIMTAHYTMSNTDVCFVWDNDALYDLCAFRLGMKCPTFTHLNRLTSQIYSSMTASMRFGGELSSNLIDYQVNLVPYPRIHFPITSYAPLCCMSRADREPCNIATMTKSLFKRRYMMCSCATEQGRYVSCCLMYRGMVSPSEMYDTLEKLKTESRINFVDWCPTAMKVSLCTMPPMTIPASGLANVPKNVMLMSNNSAVGEIFERLCTKFHHLHQKRAFMHWFVGEGMEEGEFGDAVTDIKCLVQDYKECCVDTAQQDSSNQNSRNRERITNDFDPSPDPQHLRNEIPLRATPLGNSLAKYTTNILDDLELNYSDEDMPGSPNKPHMMPLPEDEEAAMTSGSSSVALSDNQDQQNNVYTTHSQTDFLGQFHANLYGDDMNHSSPEM